MTKHPNDPLRRNLELQQRNTVWPDTVRNARNVDAYLWRGNPNAPMVQRIGAVIWGLSFLLCAASFAYEAREFWPMYSFTVGFGYVGCRAIRNAFRH